MKKIKILMVVTLIVTAKLINAQQPTFNWVSGISGLGFGTTSDMVTDASGNSYIFGTFGPSTDFDPGPSTYTLNFAGGNYDSFVLKLDVNGNFVWAKSFGANSGNEEAKAITIDPSGNIYLLGVINSYFPVDMDPGATTFTMQTTTPPSPDAYVTKLDNNGLFIWSKKISQLVGGGKVHIPVDIKSDASGVYFNALFNGQLDLDPSLAVVTVSSTVISSYHIKLDPSGNFIWGSKMGMGFNDVVNSGQISLDGLGNLYTCGSFSGTINPSLNGASSSNTVSSATYQSYIIKTTTAGNFTFAKAHGGINFAICVDNAGNICTAGSYTGTPDFDPGIGTSTLASLSNVYSDLFVNKLDATGNFLWVMGYNGNNNKNISDISFDNNNNLYISGGFTGGIDLDPSVNVNSFSTVTNLSDAFITKLNASGNFVWANVYASSGTDNISAMVIDNLTNIFTCGMLNGSINFNPPTATNTLSGSGTGFVLKLNNAPVSTNINNSFISSNHLIVYPNPSNGLVNLSGNDVITKVKITDASGKEVMQFEPTKSNIKTLEVNLKNYPNGIYFITNYSNGNAQTQKLIINH